jgi:hypothetical protein
VPSLGGRCREAADEGFYPHKREDAEKLSFLGIYYEKVFKLK